MTLITKAAYFKMRPCGKIADIVCTDGSSAWVICRAHARTALKILRNNESIDKEECLVLEAQIDASPLPETAEGTLVISHNQKSEVPEGTDPAVAEAVDELHTYAVRGGKMN
jgi:hypothetical protein